MSALESLLRRQPAHRIRWGLDRTFAMLAGLGDPHLAGEVVHVAGTNGKGSTAAMVEAALRSAGRLTGLYTSPHLHRFEERIRIGGVPAPRELLEACAADVLPLAAREDATFFEAATVLAFEAFRQAGCEVLSVEVGLGGRLDATNVVRPRVTAISSIDRDHSEYLGDTLQAIAAEKAGILKPGVPAVIGPLPADARTVVEARAREVGARLHVFGDDFEARDVSVRLEGTSFTYASSGWADGLRLRVPLTGFHQARNAALAVRCLECFDSGVDASTLASGIGGLVWPGRFEYCETPEGSWIFDIAHNAEAAHHLAELIRTLPVPRPLVLLLAVLGDKSWAEMLGPLLELSDAGIFTIAPSSPVERRWDPGEASMLAGSGDVRVERDFDRALATARELAGAGTVVVTGSAHTVGDARTLILPND